MRIKKARQILKSFADDTRLRVINLLNRKELSVSELCEVLDVQQSNLSKHLSRLLLTGVVNDRRDGLNVYYALVKSKEKVHKELINTITIGLAENETFKNDLEKMKQVVKKSRNLKEVAEKGR